MAPDLLGYNLIEGVVISDSEFKFALTIVENIKIKEAFNPFKSEVNVKMYQSL